MGVKIIRKNHEGLRDLKTFKKDLVYVPAFTNTKVLQELVADIHAQHENGEDGWEGDAVNFTSNPLVLESSDYPYLLVVGGDFAESMFAFQSKSDRDCIVSDYLPDPDLMEESKGTPAVGDEAAEKGFDLRGPKIRLVKRTHEDGYGSIKNLVDNAYRSGISRQAAIDKLRDKRGDIIYPHISGKLKDCFNNSPFKLEQILQSGDTIFVRISGDFEDGSHYWADLNLNTRTLGMSYVSHRRSNPYHYKNTLQVRIPGVKTTRVIPLDESPHLTARTPQAVRDGYLALKDFIHELRDKFETENGKIPGVAELDKEIDNLDRGGTHPLLSPGIT